MSLWNDYNEIHPNFLNRLQIIDDKSRRKIIRRLQKENDKLNFLSTVSEFLFYEFFHANGYKVEYDKKYIIPHMEKFTPDLTINKYDQDIIVEVFRLNPTKNDIEKNNFIQSFFDKRVSIKQGINLEIKLGDRANLSVYNSDDILNKLSLWLKENRNVKDVFKIDENLQFVIMSLNTGKSNIGFKSFNSIEFNIDRLSAPNSNFLNKINKYQSLLEHIKKPYIICLKTILETAINETDIFWKIYGDLTHNISTDTYRSELNGLFYMNKNSKKYLSGVLLMVNTSFFYFHNFSERRLSPQNKNFFWQYQFYLKDGFPSKVEWYNLIEK